MPSPPPWLGSGVGGYDSGAHGRVLHPIYRRPDVDAISLAARRQDLFLHDLAVEAVVEVESNIAEQVRRVDRQRTAGEVRRVIVGPAGPSASAIATRLLRES